jgi:hypothetical protein
MALRAESTNEPQAQQFVDPLTGQSYNRPSFADEVRGTEAKAIDLTMAKLAQDSYQSHVRDRPAVDGWTPLTDQQLRQVGIDPKLLHDGKTGFDAAIYGNDGRYVVAFRGTDQGKDWKTNLGQGLGFETTQYNMAVQLGSQAKVAFGDNVAFVGHSLGGGLAAAAMTATNTPGMTFNSAGLSDKTLERLGFEPDAVRQDVENGQIRNYQVKGEILTHLQEKNLVTRFVMPDAIGRDMPLPDPSPLHGLHRINPIETATHSFGLHSMDSVLQSWQMKHGSLVAERPTQSMQNMADATHPANFRFEAVTTQLDPQLQALGLNPDQRRTVSADMAFKTLVQNNDAVKFGLGTDGSRAFGAPQDDAKPYTQVLIADSINKSFSGISEKAAEHMAANPTLIAANPNLVREQPATPTPDQASPEIGGLSVGRRAP